MSTSIQVTAVLEKETKSYWKLRFENGILGKIYLPKDKPLPERITIEVKQ